MGHLLDSAKAAGTSGTNQTHLATRRCLFGDRRWFTNVLVITTTKGMLHGILGHTANLGPAVALDGVLVESPSGLEEGLVGSAPSRHNPNLGADRGWDRLLATRRQTQAGRALFIIVSDNDRKGTGPAGKGAAVTEFGFHVADNGSFRNGREREDVTNAQRRLLSAVDELTSVHAFRAEEQFGVALVPVQVAKLDASDGGASAGVVQDFLHNPANVTVLFGIIERAQFHSTLASSGVRLKDGGLSLTLGLCVCC